MHGSVVIQNVFPVDETQNKAMKLKRLRSRVQPSRHPISIEEPVGDDGVSPSSTATGQPIT